MHRDTKVGLALGVLLVGVVGAFFFRNEGLSRVDVPRLADSAEVDELIAEKAVTPYLEAESTPDPDAGGNAPHWQPPSFLRNGTADDVTDPEADVSLEPLPPIGATADPPPAPIRANGDATPISTGERFHVVQSGDTLTGIATKYLGSTSGYTLIFEANRDVLSTPDRLNLGQRLRIPSGPVRPRIARTDIPPARPLSPSPTPTPPIPAPAPVTPPPVTAPPVRPEPPANSPVVPEPTRETFDLPPLSIVAPAAKPSRPVRLFVPARRSPFVPGPSNAR